MSKQLVKVPEKKSFKQADFIMIVTVLLLLALGIIMVLSASAPTALAEDGDSYSYFKKQGVFAIVGIVAMFVISHIDYKKYRKFYWLIYWGCLILQIMVAFIGYAAGGAKRWINVLGLFSLQPSEIAKIGMIMFYAEYLSRKKDEIGELKKGFFMPLFWVMLVVAVLLLVQSHLSASILIIAVVAVMMIIAGSKMRYFLTFGIGAGALGGAGLYAAAKIWNFGTYRLARIVSFLDPWADPTGDGWQAIQNLYAIGSGGLFGVGLGASKQKYLYISEPQNDCIFAVLAEELGFVGCAIVIILFGILIWRGVVTAIKAPDMFGTLVASGITALIAIQVIINIGVVSGIMPVTGMPLPFFSYGGTSLLILLCSMGVLINISRQSEKI